MGANLKEVRERIKSVRSTQQITKAMKMVSAAKLRRAQQAITQLRPYARKLNEMLVNIMANIEGEEATTFGKKRSEIERVLVVVVTSNRGLAGAFNSNIQKAAVQLIHSKYEKQYKAGKVKVVTIGKRGYDFFRKRYNNDYINDEYVKLFDDLSFENVSSLAKRITEAYINGHYDAVEVVYSEFKNAGTQIAKSVPFLPVADLKHQVEQDDETQLRADYIFEPDKATLLEKLIPTILQTTFQSYLLDTHASEHGARMTAMDQATENANELLRDLRISYNKARQETITRELSEIVGGAAALEG